ncbi:hypothetical protein JTB14_012196 [Gonioctena quinquepunctata]|nr:hypothetical protein JTB14_012196 [Gonioctena quinquepunctata]
MRKDVLTKLGDDYNLDMNGVKGEIEICDHIYPRNITKLRQVPELVLFTPWFAYKALYFISDSISPRQSRATQENTRDVLISESSEILSSQVDLSKYALHPKPLYHGENSTFDIID